MPVRFNRNQPSTRVYLQGIGHVKVNQHRPIQGVVKTISVKREGPARWYVILSCNGVPAVPLPADRSGSIGIDMGVTHFLTTSAGMEIAGIRCPSGCRRPVSIALARALAIVNYPITDIAAGSSHI